MAGSPTTWAGSGSCWSACSASRAASALGGLAPDATLLFAARALQGAFAALMAPAALSLLTVTFTEARERARAFGVWGAIAGGGLAIGLVLGGVLTQYASWRWCLLVNTPIALLAGVAALRLIPESRVSGHTRYDIPGALTSTLGMVALVYGVTKASTDGWGSGRHRWGCWPSPAPCWSPSWSSSGSAAIRCCPCGW